MLTISRMFSFQSHYLRRFNRQADKLEVLNKLNNKRSNSCDKYNSLQTHGPEISEPI